MRRAVGSLVLGLVLLVGAEHAWSYFPFLSDDALISLRYAERLLDGHGLTWTAGERVEGYTDLAWVLLTALFGALRVDLIFAARALGVVGAAAAVIITALRPERPTSISLPRVLGGSLMLVLSGPLAAWSIGGLEHGFQAGVIVAAAWLVMRQQPGVTPPRVERILLPASLVLLAWLRADGVVLVAALLLGNVLRFVTKESLRRSFQWGLAPLAALLLQLGFRRLYYGAWVPNTALVKVSFSLARMQLGWQHVQAWAVFGVLLLVATGVAVLGQVRRGERRWVVPLLASVAWFAYLVVVGGDIFPAWRQVLLGLAPLGLVIAEGAEVWWARTRFERRGLTVVARAVLLVGWGALVVGYRHAQLVDPQNQRAHDERWEFDGASLGPFLKTAWGDRRPLLAVDAAGALPYFSQLPSLDLLGLNDRYIATHPPPLMSTVSTGHELGDGAYVWSRKPDILAMCGAAGASAPCFLGGKQLFALPHFQETYQLMRYHSVGSKDLRGDLWLRREDGVLGVQRSQTRLVVPGWLLAQSSGVAELHDGRLETLVTAMVPAHLERLRVPAGTWRVTVRTRGAPVQLGVWCEGQSVPRTGLEGLVVEAVGEVHLDLLAGTRGVEPAFVDELALERTTDAPQVRCAPGAQPAVLEVNATQLGTSALDGAHYLQPQGLKLTGRIARVHLEPGHGTRFELSVDGNDDCRLRFFVGVQLIGERPLPPRATGGLALHGVEVPAEAEVIEVSCSGGDGQYALGHFRPMP